tara:strand:+ start:110 stop:736 length:627 start_codon:yes stop_codon:yes gene_type:complete
MKTKINLKKGILLFTVVSMLVACGITVIPTLVTKDITLAKVTVSGLQDKFSYTTSTTVDLTKMVDADKLKALTTAKIKSFSLKIGDDYLNTVTNSTLLGGGFIVAVVQGLPDELNFTSIVQSFVPKAGDQADVTIPGTFAGGAWSAFFDSSDRKFIKYTFSQPFEMNDYIIDGKLKLNIAIAEQGLRKFNDASFTFELQVETEVEVEL